MLISSRKITSLLLIASIFGFIAARVLCISASAASETQASVTSKSLDIANSILTKFAEFGVDPGKEYDRSFFEKNAPEGYARELYYETRGKGTKQERKRLVEVESISKDLVVRLHTEEPHPGKLKVVRLIVSPVTPQRTESGEKRYTLTEGIVFGWTTGADMSKKFGPPTSDERFGYRYRVITYKSSEGKQEIPFSIRFVFESDWLRAISITLVKSGIDFEELFGPEATKEVSLGELRLMLRALLLSGLFLLAGIIFTFQRMGTTRVNSLILILFILLVVETALTLWPYFGANGGKGVSPGSLIFDPRAASAVNLLVGSVLILWPVTGLRIRSVYKVLLFIAGISLSVYGGILMMGHCFYTTVLGNLERLLR